MKAIEELMSRRWILKKDDPALFYMIKDNLKEIKKFMQEKLGYIIVINPQMIKLEKIPGKAEAWMGIQEFQSVREYQMLCYVLMFLEEKEKEEQFVLSSLTEYVHAQFSEESFDWTNFSARRQIVKVIKYCVSQGMLIQTEGDEERFTQDISTEVLYENTGTSRYFIRNFVRDVMEYEKPEDFENSEWINVDEDRGVVRRQRIYRKLLLSPGVYRNDDENEDFLYIRNYRNQISHDFENYFNSTLHVHKTSAYINVDEESSMGKSFPANNTISDLILFVNEKIVRKVAAYKLKPQADEKIYMDKENFLRLCENAIQPYFEKLPKKYQEQGKKQLAVNVMKEMIRYGFIEESDQVLIYPIVGKITGGMMEREGEI